MTPRWLSFQRGRATHGEQLSRRGPPTWSFSLRAKLRSELHVTNLPVINCVGDNNWSIASRAITVLPCRGPLGRLSRSMTCRPLPRNSLLGALALQVKATPEGLQRLLDVVASIDTVPLRGLLSEPLSFCGGADWYRLQIEEVLPRVEPRMRVSAREAVEALACLSAENGVFSHGDLGGHNVLWHQGRPAGVLDWDLSSESDRSTDLASLGVWHGWEKLSLIASADQVERALVRRNIFRLQQVGFLIASGRPEPEISAAAARASEWLRENPA